MSDELTLEQGLAQLLTEGTDDVQPMTERGYERGRIADRSVESDVALTKDWPMPTLFLFDVDNTLLDIDLTTLARGAITV